MERAAREQEAGEGEIPLTPARTAAPTYRSRQRSNIFTDFNSTTALFVTAVLTVMQTSYTQCGRSLCGWCWSVKYQEMPHTSCEEKIKCCKLDPKKKGGHPIPLFGGQWLPRTVPSPPTHVSSLRSDWQQVLKSTRTGIDPLYRVCHLPFHSSTAKASSS